MQLSQLNLNSDYYGFPLLFFCPLFNLPDAQNNFQLAVSFQIWVRIVKKGLAFNLLSPFEAIPYNLL